MENYISWFPDPQAITSDAFSINWSEYIPYIFPPFSLIGRILQKLQDDEVSKAIIVLLKWAMVWYGIPAMVSNVIKYANRNSSSFSYNSKSTLVSSQQSTSPSQQEENASIRLSSVRNKLKSRGFSEKSVNFITYSWRPSTNRKYNLLWAKWNIWCNQRDSNPMQPACNHLSELAEKNYSYSTINA